MLELIRSRLNCWGMTVRESVLGSKWGPADMDGKERNSNQPHNWEIMHTIVVQSRRGPLPAQLFPNRHACCCFRHLLEERESKRFLPGQLTKHSITF